MVHCCYNNNVLLCIVDNIWSGVDDLILKTREGGATLYIPEGRKSNASVPHSVEYTVALILDNTQHVLSQELESAFSHD